MTDRLPRLLVSVASLVALVLWGAACSEDSPRYEGSGTDGALVGEQVEDASACGADPMSGYDACVLGQPVRVVWRDGEPLVGDAACFADRVNVAVVGDEVVASYADCEG